MIKSSRGILGDEELTLVKEAFDYGYFGHAQFVDEFEQEIGKFLSSRNIIAVNNGTDALHISLHCLGIGGGDEVIVPSLTFVASYQAICMTGATPVSCEVDPDTLLIDPDDVERRITPRTRAIMPVHYGGNPCDMERLQAIADKYHLRIVEDAAHAFGSYYKGKRIGSFGDVTCFSFDSIKIISCGEGGIVVCRDDDLAGRIRICRQLGIERKPHTNDWKQRDWKYQVHSLGFRYHMSNINAAIGLAQLKKIDTFILRRREICMRYENAFRSHERIIPVISDYEDIAPFIYAIRIKDSLRDELFDYLKSNNIEPAINYIPNHLHQVFNQNKEHLPVTEQLYDEIISLPLHCGLSDADVDQIILTVNRFFEGCP